jgi:predicted transposase/invertase (TIGR01784 family)
VELKDQFCNVFYDKLKLIYIELPKFELGVEELTTHFDKWLYVFRHLSKLSDRPAALQERVFTRLFEAAAIANFTPTEMEAYEESLKVYRDLDNSFKTIREEGLEEGLEIGREEGREEGKKEQARAMARMMKQSGEASDKIGQYTGLTQAEIENL